MDKTACELLEHAATKAKEAAAKPAASVEAPKPATLEEQPAAVEELPATLEEQPAAVEEQPATLEEVVEVEEATRVLPAALLLIQRAEEAEMEDDEEEVQAAIQACNTAALTQAVFGSDTEDEAGEA
jgi:hypothetical protein